LANSKKVNPEVEKNKIELKEVAEAAKKLKEEYEKKDKCLNT
jgi:hypothetical protein